MAYNNCSIVSWTDTQIIASFANAVPFGPTQLAVFTQCGESNVTSFVVANPDTVSISPATGNTVPTGSIQFTSTLMHGNSSSNITSASSWYVNGILGGDGLAVGQHGTINNAASAGLYIAPASAPSGTVTVSFNYFDTNINENQTFSAASNVYFANTPNISLSPQNAFLLPGQQEQYVVTFNNGATSNLPASSIIFYVNAVPGGAVATGVIGASGLYTAPGNLANPTVYSIGASYAYLNSIINASTLVTVSAPISATTIANLTVLSQLNIYLADGRYGYVPVGSQIFAYLNQYIFVQFQELLDNQNQLPISTYLPVQQLKMYAKNALDTDIGSILYEGASRVTNQDGTISTTRTVILGIIDPSDGRFHTMWDIANPIWPTTMLSHSMEAVSIPQTISLDTPIVKNNTPQTLNTYINDLSFGSTNKLQKLNASFQYNVIGDFTFEKNTLNINQLMLLGFDYKNNKYGPILEFKNKQVRINDNTIVYISLKEIELMTAKISGKISNYDYLDEIIIGTVLDNQFHAHWPLLSHKKYNLESVNGLNESSLVSFDGKHIQWSTTEEIKITKKSANPIAVPYNIPFLETPKVYVNLNNATGGFPTKIEVSSIEHDKFYCLIENKGSTNIKVKLDWLAIGKADE